MAPPPILQLGLRYPAVRIPYHFRSNKTKCPPSPRFLPGHGYSLSLHSWWVGNKSRSYSIILNNPFSFLILDQATFLPHNQTKSYPGAKM